MTEVPEKGGFKDDGIQRSYLEGDAADLSSS